MTEEEAKTLRSIIAGLDDTLVSSICERRNHDYAITDLENDRDRLTDLINRMKGS